jgi:nitroreductase
MSQVRHPDHSIAPIFIERWSPRAFTGELISNETLLALLEAARWAPSGYNVQPWRFIFGRAGTPAWGPIFETLVPFNQEWAQRASALVVLLSATHWVPPGQSEPQPNHTHAFDVGAAWASLAFQAHLAGWQTHGIGGFDREAARRNLGVPPGHELHAVVAIGRRGDKSVLSEALQAREQPNDRLPLSALAAEGRFGFTA